MRLDLIVPTYKRHALLRKTLRSIRDASKPASLSVHLVVVDNEGDVAFDTIADGFQDTAACRLTLLHEPAPGKSNALNAGIAASDGDYVGFVDDDEEISPTWFEVVQAALATDALEFIGGPTRPLWHDPAPPWLPDQYQAVLGVVQSGDVPLAYGTAFPGILTGGNSVVARTALEAVGPLSPALGPRRDCRLFSCEDEDLYWRLIDAGARGRYLPDLIVYHHIHRERLSKRYYRSWCFWNGASKAVLRRSRSQPVPHIAGIPRYLIGRGLRGLVDSAAATIGRQPQQRRFTAELAMWELVGFCYGQHLYEPAPGTLDRPAAAPAAGAKKPAVVLQ